jgi:glycosyltransferase involved in cell wall biosynthesis
MPAKAARGLTSNNPMDSGNGQSVPLVSILLPTFNRRQYLPCALASALRQTYRNIEVLVVNDGGADVSDIINDFADERVILVNRKVNKGKPYSLNEAITRARGKYIAYLDDDDAYYTNHVGSLVEALERNPQYGAAYSDLYKAHCRVEADGSRVVLSKVLEVSRDFDRLFLLHFNHVLHVSLMHRRDLLEKTGPYNEDLRVLIDWDMTRRLSFFTDFLHIYEITGEYYGPVGDCDRISVRMRKDTAKYIKNVLMIRSTRPPKPWPKMPDLGIIYAPDRFDQGFSEQIRQIWLTTFCVFKMVLPISSTENARITISLPNLDRFLIHPTGSNTERIDAALARCDTDYVAILPDGFALKQSWVEDPLYGLMNSSNANEAIELDGAGENCWGAVFRTSELIVARHKFKHLPLKESILAAGMTLRKLRPEDLPFQFDDLLGQARYYEQEGDCLSAGRIYEHIESHCGNQLWMVYEAARSYFKANRQEKALELISKLNLVRPHVDSFLLEGKIRAKRSDFVGAIKSLSQAKEILEGNVLVWK